MGGVNLPFTFIPCVFPSGYTLCTSTPDMAVNDNTHTRYPLTAESSDPLIPNGTYTDGTPIQSIYSGTAGTTTYAHIDGAHCSEVTVPREP